MQALLFVLFVGAAACGFFSCAISPWWLIGFCWFVGIGYLTAKRVDRST